MSQNWPDTLLDPSEYRNPMRQLEDALVMVESRGNPGARRPDSQYVGLLQIGRKYAIDAGIPGGDYVRELLGNARASRQAFRRYMQKYQHIHQGDMVYVALLHHAGPIIADVREALDGGAVATIDGALQLVDAKGPAWFDKTSELQYLARTLYWYSMLEERKDRKTVSDVLGENGDGKSLGGFYAGEAAAAAEEAAGAFVDWASGFVEDEQTPDGAQKSDAVAEDEPTLMEKHYRGDFG